MYDKRVIRNHALGCLVVSIGNLSCGGTGKTPVVEVFARTLSEKGRKVAILSRGYRSKKRSFLFRLMQRFRSQKIELPPKVVSDGHNLLLESDYAGDEPFMLASNLSKVAVLVDKDRVKSGLYAVEQYQSDVIILDDGFQYLMLKPHINIVLVDSTDPFGNGNTLPRGILREPIKNIRRADYIFLTKSDGSHKINHLKNFLRRHTRRAEIIECCHKPKHLVKMFSGNQQEPLEKLRGAKVASLSAIANPESFARRKLQEQYADSMLGQMNRSLSETREVKHGLDTLQRNMSEIDRKHQALAEENLLLKKELKKQNENTVSLLNGIKKMQKYIELLEQRLNDRNTMNFGGQK